MADDQSVVGRRRIYYDPNGSEALICSDSEEEITDTDEEKHEFSDGEDRVLRWVLTEIRLSSNEYNQSFLLNINTQFISLFFFFFLHRGEGVWFPFLLVWGGEKNILLLQDPAEIGFSLL